MSPPVQPTFDTALSAICAALTENERADLTCRFTQANPRWDGAEPADILDALWQHDAHLDIREPFMEENPDLAAQPAASVALLAIIRLGRPASRDRVVSLMHRAGMAPRLGRADITALAAEVTGLSGRTRDMAAVALDELGSRELFKALADLAGQLGICSATLDGLAAATEAAP